jgi:hypothetical protein
LPFLESKNLQNGIHVSVRYKDLSGDSYHSQWRLNPFLYKDTDLISVRHLEHVTKFVADGLLAIS